MTIKNPIEWGGAQLVQAARAIGSVGHSLQHIQDTIHSPAPAIRRIGFADLGEALDRGFDDFGAYRSDVIFLGVIYTVVGLVLARLAFGMDMLPLVFPLASGFALIGPLAAIGLYEMSRRREQGMSASWANALDVVDIELGTDDEEAAIAALRDRFGLEAVRSEGMLAVRVTGGEEFVPRLFAELGVPIRSVRVSRPTLDDVFMTYTGRTIRDAEASTSERMARNPFIRARRGR